MKRRVCVILVCVVVGVVVNVSVAIWGALRAWPSFGPFYIPDDDIAGGARWIDRVPSTWPARADNMRESVRALHTYVKQMRHNGQNLLCLEHASCGWPLRSMVSSRLIEEDVLAGKGGTVDRGVWYDGIVLRSGAVMTMNPYIESRYIPVRPLCVGFVLNSLVYGVAVWPVLFVPSKVKRWRRRRRGACVGCGYELAGLVRCPECGK